MTDSHTDAAFDERAWSEIVDDSPIPTLIVRAHASSDAAMTLPTPGDIMYANAAGRKLVQAAQQPACSLFDLVDPDAHSALVDLLAEAATSDSAPLTAAVRASRSVCALYVRPHRNGTAVVRFVAHDGWQAVQDVVEQQQRFRSALMELSDLAHTTEDDDEFYQRLIERAVQVVPGAQAGSVQLNIAGTTGFRFVAAVGYDLVGLQRHVLDQADFFRDAWDPRAQIIHEFSIAGRDPVIAEWLETIGRLDEMVVNVSAPVLVEGFPVAFLALDNFEDPDAMTDTSVEMTTVLSRLIGDLWRRRDLEAKLREEREAYRHQAMHDALTGLENRRSLERALSRLNNRGDSPQAVLFADIDDFKDVNDQLGHDVGDHLLQAVAKGLKHVVRSTDIVGRWGGDEFLVVPFELNSEGEALDLAKRVLAYFDNNLELPNGDLLRARLTVGIGWSPCSPVDSDLLVRAADDALYAAKDAGKGGVAVRQVVLDCD